MTRPLFALALWSALMACTKDEGIEDRTLDCDRLTNQAWRATCGRFEAHLELIGGHGMSAARRSWECSNETFHKVYCAGAPSAEELQALRDYGFQHAGDNDTEVGTRLLGCVTGMQLFVEGMAPPTPKRHPFYAKYDCSK